jgi:BioD-like phosphotransacetylase family protein
VTQEQLTRDGSVPGHAAAILSQVGDRDVAVVEGLGGILGDGRVAQASGRMAQALDARVIVVARYHPGLKAADLTEAQEVFGERLLGLVLNRVTHYRRRWVVSELVPQFAATGVAILGTIPDDRRMVAPSVREMAEHLGAEHFLMPEKADPLVDYFMVGGFFLDEGAYVFSRRENKAVIARADRPDLHMAALATSTRALVLTGGQNPIQYVVYQAEQAGVAVLLTQASTLEAMERLHTLWERASVHHRERAERFAELMAASGSLEAILSSLGLNA